MRRINSKTVFKIILALGDMGIVAGGFLCAYWVRFHLLFFPPHPGADFGIYLRFSALIGFASFLTLYSAGLYRLQQSFLGIDDFFSIMRSITIAHLIAAAIGFAVRGQLPGDLIETYSRIVIAMSWLMGCAFVTIWRLGFDILLAGFRRRGAALTRVIILGDDDFARSFYDVLKENIELGYSPVDHLADFEGDLLRQSLEYKDVDEVMMAAQQASPDTVMRVMNTCQEFGVAFSMIPTLFHVLTSHIQVREVAGVPIFALEERIFLRSSRLLKRAIDLVVGIVASILAAPLFFIVSALIRLESKGPILHAQVRVGKGARPFRCFKFRSMYADAEARLKDLEALNEAQGPLFKMRKDPRRTKVGKFIRKFSIDELPQLINVLKGEMSLVGPRPPLPAEVDQYEAWQRKRFEVLPGMTGLAQINGRSDLAFDETLRFDFYYIENWSPLYDLKLMLKTIPKVITGRGAY